jgi:hypothetical protein
MEACKHSDISGCGISCECLCDSCQADYEMRWAKHADKENLCVSCGVPNELTPENLLAEQYTHFFQPCPACTDRFKECMKLAKLCESCHSYTEGECKNEKCEKSTPRGSQHCRPSSGEGDQKATCSPPPSSEPPSA